MLIVDDFVKNANGYLKNLMTDFPINLTYQITTTAHQASRKMILLK